MGAPLIYHGAHYGVVYVESKHAAGSARKTSISCRRSRRRPASRSTRRASPRSSPAAKSSSAICASRGRSSAVLLPANVPQVVGLDFAVHYEPAYQIGGDFYDFIWHDPAHLGLAVGDVAGKAISAALYMARLTSELRSRAAIARTPARLLRRVNQEIAALGDDGMFATLVYCIYDLETRSLVFTNAGHCVPLLRRGDRVFPLQAERAHTPPLGVTPELEAGEARVQLHSGDMLIMVSRRHPRGARCARQRVRAVAAVAPDPDGARNRRGRRQGDPRGHRRATPGSGPGRRHDDRRDGDRPAPRQAKDHDIARGCARRRAGGTAARRPRAGRRPTTTTRTMTRHGACQLRGVRAISTAAPEYLSWRKKVNLAAS